MDIKEEITAIKTGFNALLTEFKMKFGEAEQAPEEAAMFGEATLTDGTIVLFPGEAPEVGAPLTIKGVDGEVPAPDGVHETDSGKLITTEAGAITAIEEKAAEATEEEPIEEMAQFASLEQFEALMTANAEMTDRMAKLEGALLSVIGKVEESFSVLEKFAAKTPEPAAKPISAFAKKEQNLSNFSKALNNLKK